MFSSLDTSLTYTLEILSSSAADAGLVSDFTANGVFANRTETGVTTGAGASMSVGDDWRPFTDGSSIQDWMIWDSLTAAGGTLTIDIQPEDGSRAHINALRLTGLAVTAAVPEPGSLIFCPALLLVFSRSIIWTPERCKASSAR